MPGGIADPMIGVGVVGYGYWGPLLARNLAAVAGIRVIAICDSDPDGRALAAANHASATVTDRIDDLLVDPAVDAVAIATPAATHYGLTRRCLDAGKHVLIEKPLAATSGEAATLTAQARKRGLVLLVDHTFLYSHAVEAIAEAIANGELGELRYFDSVRTNLGRFRSDVDVLWDLASHDLAIIDALFPQAPTTVQATGFARQDGTPHELAYVTLRWGASRIAHIHVSWLTPIKIRRTLIGGSRAMIVWDDIDPDTKVRFYDVGAGTSPADADPRHLRTAYRRGEMRAPWLPVGEPLGNLASHFVDCIVNGREPRSGGASGRRVIRLLEATRASIEQGGMPIVLDSSAENATA